MRDDNKAIKKGFLALIAWVSEPMFIIGSVEKLTDILTGETASNAA
jgi:hypothetical protein